MSFERLSQEQFLKLLIEVCEKELSSKILVSHSSLNCTVEVRWKKYWFDERLNLYKAELVVESLLAKFPEFEAHRGLDLEIVGNMLIGSDQIFWSGHLRLSNSGRFVVILREPFHKLQRRRSFRIRVPLNDMYLINIFKGCDPVIKLAPLYDLSATGFSFTVTDQKYDVTIGTEVIVEFLGSEMAGNRFKAMVRRFDPKKKLVGLEFCFQDSSEANSIFDYVMNIYREHYSPFSTD